MILRFSMTALFCAGVSLADAEPEIAVGAMPAILGIPFQQIEASGEGGKRDWGFVATGRLPGTNAIARYEQRMNLGPNGWEAAGRFDLPLSRADDVAPLLANFPSLAGLSGSGSIGFSAEFSGRGEDKKWEGALELQDIFLEHRELGLSVEGLGGTFTWAFAEGAFTTAPRQVLAFELLRWDEVKTGAGELEFEMVSAEEWRLGRVVLDWAGGRLSAGTLSFNPRKPDVTMRLIAGGILLEELLQMAPDFYGRGEGIIDGELSLRVRRQGIGLEPGHLGLRPGVPARLQLSRHGLLTEETFPEKSSDKNLRMVERALEDLELSRFRLDFLSEEDPDIPLRLIVEGKPLAGDVPAPSVSLTLNVRGPIKELGSWVLIPGVRVGIQ